MHVAEPMEIAPLLGKRRSIFGCPAKGVFGAIVRSHGVYFPGHVYPKADRISETTRQK
jgi:hypothetical protein